MKTRKRAQFSSMFLLELILAILFFSIASAVCVQIFVKSHLISRSSTALSGAVNDCGSLAQIVSGLVDNYPDQNASAEDMDADQLLAEILELTEESFAYLQVDPLDSSTSGIRVRFLYDSIFERVAPDGESPSYSLVSEIRVDKKNHLVTCDSVVKTIPADSGDAEAEVLYSQSTIHHIQRRVGE